MSEAVIINIAISVLTLAYSIYKGIRYCHTKPPPPQPTPELEQSQVGKQLTRVPTSTLEHDSTSGSIFYRVVVNDLILNIRIDRNEQNSNFQSQPQSPTITQPVNTNTSLSTQCYTLPDTIPAVDTLPSIDKIPVERL